MTKLALRSTLLAGLALACAAPVASADSIVFIDGGNVAVSQPDGSGKVQLTDGGGWHSPTQADDGTIAAVDTNQIVVMAKDGRVLRRIATPKDVRTSNGGSFSGTPVNLSFSPDGTKLAYAYVESQLPRRVVVRQHPAHRPLHDRRLRPGDVARGLRQPAGRQQPGVDRQRQGAGLRRRATSTSTSTRSTPATTTTSTGSARTAPTSATAS